MVEFLGSLEQKAPIVANIYRDDFTGLEEHVSHKRGTATRNSSVVVFEGDKLVEGRERDWSKKSQVFPSKARETQKN